MCTTASVVTLCSHFHSIKNSEWHRQRHNVVYISRRQYPSAITEPERLGVVTKNRERIAYTLPQNTQANDATIRIHNRMPSANLLHVYTFDVEFASFLAPESTPPESMPLDGVSTASERSAIAWLHKFKMSMYKDRNPALDCFSLSETARRKVWANPEEYPVMVTAWREYRDDPATHSLNRKIYHAEVRRIFSEVIEETQIIVGTPVALQTLYNHEDWQPTFIIVDKAGRFTEAMALLAISNFPKCPALFIGDTKQFGPMAIVEEDTKQSRP